MRPYTPMQHCHPYFAFVTLRTHFIFNHPQSTYYTIHNTNILITLGWILDNSEIGLSRATSFTMWVLGDFATPVDTDGRNTLYRNCGEKKERENNLLLGKTDFVLRNTIEFILNSFKMTISLITTNLPWEAVLCKKRNQKQQLGNLCFFFLKYSLALVCLIWWDIITISAEISVHSWTFCLWVWIFWR